MDKKSKIEILSFTYKLAGKIYTAKVSPERNLLREENCICGSERCVNGVKQRCYPVDNEGTCIWFESNDEKC